MQLRPDGDYRDILWSSYVGGAEPKVPELSEVKGSSSGVDYGQVTCSAPLISTVVSLAFELPYRLPCRWRGSATYVGIFWPRQRITGTGLPSFDAEVGCALALV